MIAAGIWLAAVNLGLFAWALNAGQSLKHAMTLSFVTLVLTEFFKAYNFRSARNSILNRPLANRWLNLAVLWEIVLLALIIYLPFLQAPFGTIGLSPADWTLALGMAFTITPILELAKWMVRRGFFGRQE